MIWASKTLKTSLALSGSTEFASPRWKACQPPKSPPCFVPLRRSQIAACFYFSGDYKAAVEAAQGVIRSNPEFPFSYRYLAAALGQIGRPDEAKEALAKTMALAPAYFDMYVRSRPPWMRPEDHAHMVEGLRKAGWTE